MYTGFSRFGGRLFPVLWNELLDGAMAGGGVMLGEASWSSAGVRCAGVELMRWGLRWEAWLLGAGRASERAGANCWHVGTAGQGATGPGSSWDADEAWYVFDACASWELGGGWRLGCGTRARRGGVAARELSRGGCWRGALRGQARG
jgi:hypothetical protein